MITLDNDQIDLLKWLSIAEDVSIRSKSDESAAQFLDAAGLAHFTSYRVPGSTIRGQASITAAGIAFLQGNMKPVFIGIDMAEGRDISVVWEVKAHG